MLTRLEMECGVVVHTLKHQLSVKVFMKTSFMAFYDKYITDLE